MRPIIHTARRQLGENIITIAGEFHIAVLRLFLDLAPQQLAQSLVGSQDFARLCRRNVQRRQTGAWSVHHLRRSVI